MRPLPSILILTACGLLGSCGAGVITGGLLGGGGGGGSGRPPLAAPTLAVDRPEAPLVNPDNQGSARILFVNNLAIPAGVAIEVQLRALGAVSKQVSPVLLSGGGNNSRIGFVEQHQEILTELTLPRATEADVEARLFLLVDGARIGRDIPFVLRRRPVAKLAGAAKQAFLSVQGTTRVSLVVSGGLATRAEDIKLRIATRNPLGKEPLLILRNATDVKLQMTSSGDLNVSGIAPPNEFPGQAFAEIVDSRAGESTTVDRVFYVPAIVAATPRFLPTDGGVDVTVAGKGLVPLDFGAPSPFPLNFDALSLELRRGGRTSVVPPSLLRRGKSSPSRLVFTVPPSPDGRPGPAELRLKVELGVAQAEVSAKNLVVYRHRNPVFGPRGVLLDAPPTRIQLAALIDPAAEAPDAVMLTSVGRLARAQVLVAEHNGLFERLGIPVVAADAKDPRQRDPVALCPGDFDADGRTDLFVLHRGASSVASHSLLLGQPAPLPPLRLASGAVGDASDARHCKSGDVDGDKIPDLLILPAENAASASPRLFSSQGSRPGSPRFSSRKLPDAITRNSPYQALDLIDLDGDGFLDLVFFAGGLRMFLVTAYGDGVGAFPVVRKIPLSLTGYTPDAASPAIGVHGCGPGKERSIVVVLAGTMTPSTPPALAVLAPIPGKRQHQLVPASVRLFAGKKPFSNSVVGDLDRDGIGEMVLAAEGETPPLSLFVWKNGVFEARPSAVDPGIESMVAISSLEIDVAVPARKPRFPEPIMALFVSHEFKIASGREDRLSVMLAGPGPRLISPDASVQLASVVLGLALGNFSGREPEPGGEALDMLVAAPGLIAVLGNDGVGGFAPQRTLQVSTAVPSTLAAAELTIPGVTGDSAVYLQADGRLAVLLPGKNSPILSPKDLRLFAPARLRGRNVASSSRLLAADVDGDGISDIAVLLTFEGVHGEGDAILLILKGRVNASTTAFPLHLPDGPAQAALTHGNASSIALGDFAATTGSTRLELALAVPQDRVKPGSGNQVRFYHLDPGTSSPSDDRFVASFSEPSLPILIAGDQPAALAGADLDGNGTIDLAVASAGDSKAHVFLNSGAVILGKEGRVNISAFQETSSAPPSLPPGIPTGMFLGDLNGDGVPDLVVSVLHQPGPSDPKDHGIASFLSSGTGILSSALLIPNLRTGNTIVVGGKVVLRDAAMHPALGDINADGRPDLVLGWGTSGLGDRNLHFLFGGVR